VLENVLERIIPEQLANPTSAAYHRLPCAVATLQPAIEPTALLRAVRMHLTSGQEAIMVFPQDQATTLADQTFRPDRLQRAIQVVMGTVAAAMSQEVQQLRLKHVQHLQEQVMLP